MEDLGYDGLSLYLLKTEIEEELMFDIDDNEMFINGDVDSDNFKHKTVGDLLNYINSRED